MKMDEIKLGLELYYVVPFSTKHAFSLFWHKVTVGGGEPLVSSIGCNGFYCKNEHNSRFFVSPDDCYRTKEEALIGLLEEYQKMQKNMEDSHKRMKGIAKDQYNKLAAELIDGKVESLQRGLT